MNAPSVLVVGSINVDLVAAVAALPRPGETVIGPAVERHGGGKGANAAVAAARLGARVALIGAVGDDDLGAGALAELRAEGIDVEGVAVLAGVPTGAALIVVDAAGENQIAVGAGANHALEPGRGRRGACASASTDAAASSSAPSSTTPACSPPCAPRSTPACPAC